MKQITSILGALFALALPNFARAESDYSVFRVCEDQHIIRTSDGAEAGHVEYIVIDPGQGRIVSSIVSGGTLGEKFVAVPYSSMRFGADREVVLTEITRERLVAAPVIERTKISATVRFDPVLVERSYTHFGVRRDAVSVSRVEGRSGNDRATVRETDRERSATETNRSSVRGSVDAGKDPDRVKGEAGSDGTKPTAQAPRDGDRSTTPEATKENSRPGGKAAKEGRTSAESAREGGRAKEAADDARKATPEAARENGRSAREVTGEAGRAATEKARGAAERTKDAAEKAESAGKPPGAARNAEKAGDTAHEPAGQGTRGPDKAVDSPEKAKNAGDRPGEKPATKEPEGKPKADRKEQ